MFGLSWWVWVIVVVVVLVVLYWLALQGMSKAFRFMIRRQFVDFLNAVNPDVEVVDVTEARLQFGIAGKTCEIEFEPVYKTVVDLQSDDEKALAYWRFVKQHDDQAEGGPSILSLEKVGERVMPWLAPDRELSPGSPRTPLGNTGLNVISVLDCGDRGLALNEEFLADLGTDGATVHAKAIENLEKLGPISEEAIAETVKGESGSVIGFDDRYNAVRILLVQQRLAEGESIAAMIPNRHILALLPLPSVEGGLDQLREASGLAEFEVDLLDRPIRVTRESLELL